MKSMRRTFAIGDIHGEISHLERLLDRLPTLHSDDTLVFLGDYLDRGLESKRVIERVSTLHQHVPAKVVPLLGNHEEAWLRSLKHPEPGFLLRPENGCFQTLRALTDCASASEMEQAAMLLQPTKWFPTWIHDWMDSLPLYYEDEHAIYVHAGLDGEGETWLHPKDGRKRNLLWCREPDFYRGYKGKRLCFGHTLTKELPVDHLSWFGKILDDPSDVWMRGDLIGLDTACGKNGYLSAIELPSGRIFASR
jgi:serine/threonine protein phosphatase 1